jgi:hypothetical protein
MSIVPEDDLYGDAAIITRNFSSSIAISLSNVLALVDGSTYRVIFTLESRLWGALRVKLDSATRPPQREIGSGDATTDITTAVGDTSVDLTFEDAELPPGRRFDGPPFVEVSMATVGVAVLPEPPAPPPQRAGSSFVCV